MFMKKELIKRGTWDQALINQSLPTHHHSNAFSGLFDYTLVFINNDHIINLY